VTGAPRLLVALRCTAMVVVALGLAAPAHGSWQEVLEADAAFDLVRARRLALETVGRDPSSADSVAVTGWWLGTLQDLAEPEAILTAFAPGRDPEASFLLARIQSELDGRPPAGVLTTVELAGPFGTFDVLDLERDVVPPDFELPPLGSTWRTGGAPVRLLLRPVDGWLEPPQEALSSGVFLAAWSFAVEGEHEAWLVVEAVGGVNISLDDRVLDRRRDCGVVDPSVGWYRVELREGCHRLRVEMASPRLAGVRVSLLDRAGDPLPVVPGECDSVGRGASAGGPSEPPAAAALGHARDRAARTEVDCLVAAAVARGRLDPRTERAWLERAQAASPGSPWPDLGLAQLYLSQPTGNDPDVELNRAREHLRSAAAAPLSRLLEQVLARRQRRNDDADQVLDRLVEDFGSDPRVLQLWVRRSLHNGWTREAEDGVARLEEVLPASRRVAELRLLVLEGLERWDERTHLMAALAESGTISLEQVDELRGECHGSVALAALERLRASADDPSLDLAAVRILAERGDSAQALAELERVREHWGDMFAVADLSLALAAEPGGDLDAALGRALAAKPANLRLQTLAWRRGAEPFFAPFRVDALKLTAGEGGEAEDVDAVLILDQAVERCFADGSSLYYYHGLTKAYTATGARQAAALQQMEESVTLRVRIVKPDGREVVPTDLESGQGGLVLSEVEPGDLVEEEFVAANPGIGGSRPGHLSPYTYRFADPERAFGLSEFVLLAPRDLKLEVEGNFRGLAQEQWEEGDLSVTRWRAERMPPVPQEPFSPPVRELLPWISYGFGVTWQDVGDAVRDRILEVLTGTPDLEAWAAAQVTGDEPVPRVRRVVEAVIGEVEAGRALLDLRSTAGESFSRRRGNRLAVVAAALMVAGWQVDVVLARPVEFAGTHMRMPSMESFFEPLLRVTVDGRLVWVDLDEERRGIDHIRPQLQRSDALLLPLSDPRAPVTYLERLPEFETPELEERVLVRAEVEGSGRARIRLEMPMWGGQAERLQEEIASLPEQRVDQAFQQMAASLFPGAESVRGDLERQGEGVLLRLWLDLPSACELAGESLTCRSLVLARPLSAAFASLPQRQFPLVLQLPLLQRVELEMTLPEGWTMDRQPRRFEARWGRVDETVEAEPGGARSVLRLQVDAQTVTPEDYPEFVRFCHAVDELVMRPPELVRAAP